MSKASDYKSGRTLPVTLSTGDTIKVRRFTRDDYLSIGDIPSVLRTEDAAKIKASDLPPDALEFFRKLTRRALLHCVVSPDFKIVDKPAGREADDEISVELIADEDTQKILDAAQGGKEAALNATSFRAEQDPAAGAGPDGPAVFREPAVAA